MRLFIIQIYKNYNKKAKIILKNNLFQLLLLEKVENLRDEVEEVLDGLEI